MPEYMINEVPVNFPYEPYSVQTTYMEKVIECLKTGVNGMLESPTGTGKTLCLLCASLSWLTLKKLQIQVSSLPNETCNDLFRGLQNAPDAASSSTWNSVLEPSSVSLSIIYASRTHSQLTQVIQELKKSGYSHIKVSVLGSREQLCINPLVSQVQEHVAKVNKCRALIKVKNCYFYNNVERKMGNNAEFMDNAVMDIEDLVKAGQKKKLCPYYTARELKNNADIIFIPYNYILDQKRMRTQDISLAGNIVILDEAHNIEKICEESVSMSISSTDVALCITEITQIMEDFVKNNDVGFNETDDSPSDFNLEDLCMLKAMFLELERAIDGIELKSEDATFPGPYIVELLAQAQVTQQNYNLLLEVLQNVIQFRSVTNQFSLQFKAAALQKVVELLDLVFKSSTSDFVYHFERLKKNFKVHVTAEESKSSKQTSDFWNNTNSTNKTNGKVISFMCFSPSYGMKELMKQGVRCVIFTSGTLSPLPALMSELDISIPITLENPHVIGQNQVNVCIVKKGADGFELNSSYRTRNDPKYINSLGGTILNMSRIVPHGLLVFFPSYPVMYMCKEAWQESGVWSQITKMKPIFVEPRSKDSFSQVMREYYEAVQDPTYRGACFMAVTRGKVSEGLDFVDVNGRAVIVTGLPYPPMKDAYVKLKKEYLSENCKKEKDSNCLTADQWYLYEATRAVNQAIGRVIRHKDDYGAIILCDSRFEQKNIMTALSTWIQPQIKKYDTFGPVIRDLKKFFFNVMYRRDVTVVKSNIPLASDVILGEYVSTVNESSRSEAGPESGKKKDLFSALDKPTTVIDFNAVNIMPLSQTSGCNSSCSSIAKSSASTSKSEQNKETNEKSNNTEPRPSDKQTINSTVVYFEKVKKSLDTSNYYKFKSICFEYDKTKDINKLLTYLQDIFLGESRNFTSLFRDFRCFVKSRHRNEFDDF
ncbi:hypothetical protein L9F63_018600, partial [Diploptera punctata]